MRREERCPTKCAAGLQWPSPRGERRGVHGGRRPVSLSGRGPHPHDEWPELFSHGSPASDGGRRISIGGKKPNKMYKKVLSIFLAYFGEPLPISRCPGV